MMRIVMIIVATGRAEVGPLLACLLLATGY